jgi:hypothetical protein
VAPAAALATLTRYQGQLAAAREEAARLAAARDALGLEPTAATAIGSGGGGVGEDALAAAEREAAELREVWSALSGVWDKVGTVSDVACTAW